MLERIRRERGSGSDFLSISRPGSGGMIEAEVSGPSVANALGHLGAELATALIALGENKMFQIVMRAAQLKATNCCGALKRRYGDSKTRIFDIAGSAGGTGKIGEATWPQRCRLFAKQYPPGRRETITRFTNDTSKPA